MKKIIFSMVGIYLLTSAHLLQAAEGNAPASIGKSAPVSRVIEMCHGKTSEINITALEQAAQVLKSSHPELAVELEKMAKESIN